MKTIEMKVIRIRGSSSKSRLWGKKIRLSGVKNSPAIELPFQPIDAVAIHQTGTADIYLTNYSCIDIENDTAEWSLYDNISEINKSITGIYAENKTGSTKIMITVTRNI